MQFLDRWSAGVALARLLAPHYSGKEVVVYALPRGGVPVAAPIAKALNVPLELCITRKIGHPRDSEYALGALTEEGDVLWDTRDREGVDEWWLATVMDVEKQEAERRRRLYLGGKPRRKATDKVAIIVDDGAATGLTMGAAIQSLKKDNPSQIVIAVPVAPHTVVEALQGEADRVFVLNDIKEDFRSVGRFYESFAQVDDMEVMAHLGHKGIRLPLPRENAPVRRLRLAPEVVHKRRLA
jgi:putative phosphoribosyl transferase